MRRIGWQRRTRAEQLQVLLNQRLAKWWAEWLGEERAQVRCASTSTGTSAPVIHCLTSGHAAAWLQCARDSDLIFGRDALRLKTPSSNTFAREVGKRCLADLHAKLFGDSATVERSTEDAAIGVDSDPRFGALCFELQGLPCQVTLTVNRSWCDQQEPVDWQPQATEHLFDRREVLGATSVTLSANLALGEISVFDSLTWQVGEVLVAEKMRDLAVTLEVGRSEVLSGKLAVNQGERIISLAGKPVNGANQRTERT